MSSKENILQYELCIMCNNNLAKLGGSHCKKCKIKPIKPIRNRVKNEDSCKIYYYKFHDKNTKARLRLNSSKSDIGYSLCIEPSPSPTRQSGPIQNSDLFLIPTWDQFKSLKEFTSCIIKSDQINISYFVISCSTFVQNLPKFQHFIKNKAIELPPESLFYIEALPFPLTRPLQLLYQQSFWDELLILYFKEYHPMSPLFSIRSFDHKTASPTLLNAMCYCGYISSKKRPNEITEYMDRLADQNIKKIVKNATIDNVRALIIHTNTAQWSGNLVLAKSLQAHLSRMSYLLGLHLNYNKLSQEDRYNRDVLLCMARMCNIGLSGSHSFTPNYIAGYKKSEPHLYDIKWQLPGPSSIIYSENEMKNQLYACCSTLFFKFANVSSNTVWFPLFFKQEANSFHKTWTYKIEELNKLYESTAQSLKDLKEKHHIFKSNITPFETFLKISYHGSVIEMYEVLKHKNKILQTSEVSIVLEHCHGLYHALSTAEQYCMYFQYYAHVVGLHYLNIYPRCSLSEKQRTKKRLFDLILFTRDKFYSYFSLSYLILKNGYDSLDDS